MMDNFAVGLAAMAMERLPATLFPPLQVQAKLKEIKSVLPSGWSLSPSIQKCDVWKVYTEAKVVVTADEARSRTQCTTHVSPWLGQQTVYLGHSRWGYSTTEDTTITITCPQSREKVPMSCTAHTDNWIFQASFRKNVKYALNNLSLPSLTELEKVGQVLKAPEDSETILERERGARNQNSQPILTRRAMIQGRVALMGEHLKEEEKARRGAGQPETVRYPFELIAVMASLFFGLGAILFVRLRQTGQP
ncbi:hypothetical protein OUZ56_008955 [Daphnia magna]|uniref:Uncharacterized protein n=1 Tax=Daphnia magna TaxID=35525 RepID=A0ABR0AEJ4_9CRUS|nr:hypothetical protein OUZ56_008955 [Daphnia magna]